MSIYSLKISARSVPKEFTAEGFVERFVNKDNVVEACVVRDFSAVTRKVERLFELDRRIKQMEINLSPEFNPGKRTGCCK